MCMACEEQGQLYRWQLLYLIAGGEMPEGMTEAHLRELGLPLPGEVVAVENADGVIAFKRVSPPETSTVEASAFVCDSPDGE